MYFHRIQLHNLNACPMNKTDSLNFEFIEIIGIQYFPFPVPSENVLTLVQIVKVQSSRTRFHSVLKSTDIKFRDAGNKNTVEF